MKNFSNDNNGQALIFVILTLLVVFFIAIAVSEGVSRDTISALQNQDSQQAYGYAKTALDAAVNYLENNDVSTPIDKFDLSDGGSSICSNSQNNAVGGNEAHCIYTITPLDSINQPLKKDTPIQITLPDNSSGGSLDFLLKNFDNSSLLLINMVISNGPQRNFSNKECLIFRADYISPENLPKKNDSNFENCPNSELNASGELTGFNLPAKTKFVRIIPFTATSLNNTQILVKVKLLDGSHPIQEYRIIATGYLNGSRRVIETFFNKNGVVPGIFDYVLFNNSTHPITNK